MPLDSTAVVVADDGTETLPAGSMATDIYNGLKSAVEAQFGAFAAGAEGAKPKQGLALTANGIASGVVSNIRTNADVIVGTGDAGLQRDPSSGNPTLAPSAPVTMAGVID